MPTFTSSQSNVLVNIWPNMLLFNTVLHLESDKAWVIMLNTCLPSCIHIMFIFGLKHIINVCFMTPVCSLHPWPTSGPSFTHLVLLNLWSLVDSHYGHRITVLDSDWLTVWKYLGVTYSSKAFRGKCMCVHTVYVSVWDLQGCHTPLSSFSSGQENWLSSLQEKA